MASADTKLLASIAYLEKKIAELQLQHGKDGLDGKDGVDGGAGSDGAAGKDGRDGKDGKDGKDGVDGEDGVGVVDADVDFDNRLRITLSDGTVVDAGSINAGGGEGSTQILGIGKPTHFDQIQFNGGAGDQGVMRWNADEETVDLVNNGAVTQIGQEMHIHVRNNTGVLIPNGTVVYATGTIGASGRLTVAPFTANDPNTARFILGVTTEVIENDTDGKVTAFGKVRGIDTSGFNEFDVLYASDTVAGAFTTVDPTPPNPSIPLGYVVNSKINGEIFFRVTPTDEHHTVGGTNLYVQTTQPVDNGKYLWIDTSAGNITFWVEDGL